ncbi:MAG: Kelch repeat-containing protein [Thermoanaerobaculia bacterium]
MPRLVRAVLLAALLHSWVSLTADVVWKVADEGPRTPVAVEIVGDDARTIAVATGGAAEFDGTRWLPVALNTDAVLPKEREMYAVGGQIGAYSVGNRTLNVYLLQGSTWSLAASVPFSYQPFGWNAPPTVPRGADRVYVPDPAFFACGGAKGCPPEAAARGLRSISLVDGSIREEPSLPLCAGFLFGVADHLFVLQSEPSCGGGPSSAGISSGALAAGAASYRLDGDRWTELEPWTRPFPYFFTANAAWIFEEDRPTSARSLTLLTRSGFSPPIPIPAGQLTNNPKPLEWNGRMILSAERIYEVSDGALLPFAPDCPIPGERLFAVGSRLFAWNEGWNVASLSGSAWEETSGVPEVAGGQVFFKGRTKHYAIRGNRLFRRDDSGWVGLPPSPSSADLRYLYAGQFVFLEDDPVFLDQGYSGTYGAWRYDAPSDSWVDLQPPPAMRGPALVHDGDLYVGNRDEAEGRLAVRHDGAWSTLETGAAVWQLREANGQLYVFGCRTSESDYAVCRLDEGRLVPAFPGLATAGMNALDVVGRDGETLVSVSDRTPPEYPQSLRRVLVSADVVGYRTVLRQGDLRDAGHGSYSQDLLSPLVRFGEQLLLPGLSFRDGQLRAQRSPMVPSILDPKGRFAFRDSASMEYNHYRGPLLVPSARVRKNLVAAVDTTGVGGTRYRSVLLVANFSETETAVARVFAAAHWNPFLEIPLGPRVQVAIDDPKPGFLGPMAVEFEGLTDEADAWAAIRVWSPSDGGTAGTLLVGTNPGVVPQSAVVVPPPGKSGSRLQAAFSASGDGGHGPVRANACPLAGRVPGEPDPCVTVELLRNGAFFQAGVPAAALLSPIQFWSTCYNLWCYPLQRTDDLGGYLVRNENGTNDGAIVPFDRPDVMEGRKVRFLPALVSLTSARGTYRTELTLGWRSPDAYPPLSLDFGVTFRSADGAWTIPITIHARQVVEIPDAGAWLAAHGIPVDPANAEGTLTFTADREEGAASLLVTAVVTARGPGASGDYGVTVPVLNEVEWASSEAIVPGLREDEAFRTNLALANPEPDGGPSATLEVSIHGASDGKAVGTLPQVTLAPGQRVQLNQLLATIDFSGDAFALVRRTGGTGRFVAYAVMNDNVTGDGTLFPMTRSR